MASFENLRNSRSVKKKFHFQLNIFRIGRKRLTPYLDHGWRNKIQSADPVSANQPADTDSTFVS